MTALPPIVRVLAEWEDANGSIAGILPEEWSALWSVVTDAAIEQSPRQLRTALSTVPAAAPQGAELVDEAWTAIREARKWLTTELPQAKTNALVALNSVRDDPGRVVGHGPLTPPAAAEGALTERALFEAEARDKGFSEWQLLERAGDGYENENADIAWCWWQWARAALSTPPAAAPQGVKAVGYLMVYKDGHVSVGSGPAAADVDLPPGTYDLVLASTPPAEGALTKQQADKLANEIMDLVQAMCEKWTHGDASEVGCAKEAVEEAVFNLASFAALSTAPAQPVAAPVGTKLVSAMEAFEKRWPSPLDIKMRFSTYHAGWQDRAALSTGGDA